MIIIRQKEGDNYKGTLAHHDLPQLNKLAGLSKHYSQLHILGVCQIKNNSSSGSSTITDAIVHLFKETYVQ